MFRKVAVAFLLSAILMGCMRTITLQEPDKRLQYDVHYYQDTSGILHKSGISLGESPIEIKFKDISLSRLAHKIKIAGTVRTRTGFEPVPSANLSLFRNKEGKMRLDKNLPEPDSLGRFTFTAKIDTGSVLFLDCDGCEPMIYHLGNFLK